MKYITTEKLPIKSWCNEPEEGAIAQAKNLANLPFAFHHIALMPDTHQGYGMPIGGVLATDGIIVPNAVGVDIGCGMCVVESTLTEIEPELLRKIMGRIREAIPLGFAHHKEKQDENLMPKRAGRIVEKEYENALYSLGTLGGGNHFIEIQKGSDGYIWIMIHSGSRNLGKQVAEYYDKLAKDINKDWYSAVPLKWDLAFLDMHSNIGEEYLQEMQYCVNFAYANRKLMMDRIREIFIKEMHQINENIFFKPMINIAHNYAKLETHFGKNVMVHRKGTTLADKDTIGIIPGSQGTKSYIVKGKGNPESFNSCSHGAGRKMGRGQAIKNLNLEDEIARLDSQGIIHGIRTKQDLDEASGAYKDIDLVMEEQKDLVEILVELTPLAVIKG